LTTKLRRHAAYTCRN